MKFYLKFKIFIQENVFENAVSKMAAILSWGRLVNQSDSKPKLVAKI